MEAPKPEEAFFCCARIRPTIMAQTTKTSADTIIKGMLINIPPVRIHQR
jgi:hypothetical protein